MDAKIHVIGAGLGGVAAAIALARNGAQVVVLEQAADLTEVGAGLQISANGMVVLRALGVVGEIPPDAVRSTGTEIRDFATGRPVTFLPPPAAGPTWYFHRADLLDLLVAQARTMGVQFELGTTVQSYQTNDGGCTLTLADGVTRHAGLVVAALSLPLPKPVDDITRLLGTAAAPCALFAMGAALPQYRIAGNVLESSLVTILKLAVHPLLVWLLATYVFTVDPLHLQVAVLLAATPVGANVYLLAARYNVGTATATTSVFLTTAASLITLSVVLLLITAR